MKNIKIVVNLEAKDDYIKQLKSYGIEKFSGNVREIFEGEIDKEEVKIKSVEVEII